MMFVLRRHFCPFCSSCKCQRQNNSSMSRKKLLFFAWLSFDLKQRSHLGSGNQLSRRVVSRLVYLKSAKKNTLWVSKHHRSRQSSGSSFRISCWKWVEYCSEYVLTLGGEWIRALSRLLEKDLKTSFLPQSSFESFSPFQCEQRSYKYSNAAEKEEDISAGNSEKECKKNPQYFPLETRPHDSP